MTKYIKTLACKAQKKGHTVVRLEQKLQVLNIVPIQRPSSHDVTTALLVSQNKEAAATLVFLTNLVGVEL